LFFSAIVAATPAIATRFPISKTTIIQNFPIKDELCTISSIDYDNKPQSMVYMGGITRIRGIEENIKAFGRIKHQNCRFLLAGSFSDENFKKESASLIGWSSVDYLGYLSREKVRHVLEKSRAGFVLFHPVPNHVDAQPNKLFEYMSAGVPIIASDFPLWRKIVRGSDCGLLVDPMKPEEIAKAIDWILDNPKKAEIMGENGRQAVADHYNWLHEEKVLLDLYGKLTT
jgi:glycosyltransferase involved in cell wall biosynthesis